MFNAQCSFNKFLIKCNRYQSSEIKEKNHTYSYIIQHFYDTFRQCVIDLIHGNLEHYNELQDDNVLQTILSITDESLDVPDSRHFNYGALNNEMKLAETLVESARSAKDFLFSIFQNFNYNFFFNFLCHTATT